MSISHKKYHLNRIPLECGKRYLNAMVMAANFVLSIDNKTKVFTGKKQIECNDGSPVNKINYLAIVTLETLGIYSPSQEQIDVIETLLLLADANKTDDFEEPELYGLIDLIGKPEHTTKFGRPNLRLVTE